VIFKSPFFLVLIAIVPVLFFYWTKSREKPAVLFSDKKLSKGVKSTLVLNISDRLFYLPIFALILMIIALSRPQKLIEKGIKPFQGVDIVLALDASGSMLAEDFKIEGKRKSRLAIVKEVVNSFVKDRKNDRMAIVAFAGRAYTVCPLTSDYQWLLRNLNRVEIGAIEDGTAIGSALSSSINRLKSSEAKTKLVILLTDGVNNVGEISPQQGALIAKAFNVKVYTIAVGVSGIAPYPVKTFWGEKVYRQMPVEIDEEVLKTIAQTTGGKFYRAKDTKALRDIYKEIDGLEKTEIKTEEFFRYREMFNVFLVLAFSLLVLEKILRLTLLKRFP